MNKQTIFVTPSGSSTLEFQTIERVPVYEPAQRGMVNIYCTINTITAITEWGDVTRFDVTTGCMDRWYTRPGIAEVVTMNMKHGIKGYYYEFAKDGSIRSSSGEGVYYWGPVVEREVDDPPVVGFSTVRDYMMDGRYTAEEMHAFHAELLKQCEINEDSEMFECDDETPEERYANRLAAIEAWRDALKARVEQSPGVRDVPANKEMHEHSIRTAEMEIARLTDDDNRCLECRRENICMCYT